MTQSQFPIETISSIISIIIVIGIFLKFFQYKQKLDVLKELDRRKDMSKLTPEDKTYIKRNYNEYKEKQIKIDALTRLIFPIFITIAAILFFFLPLEKTLIHLNVIIVLYIYLQIHRIHTRNFAKFLEELSS
ncbi:hypothetical protein CPU12_08295 [Malaciobacter molluscorum LMG 25693]|uniref:Membrane protein n=1 Tax=Malaciobacter molluscorum LMG 25693 TaxID=870501 RepID=A0A2G1DHV4_9BACT|nr:hypothetical protein [Malaciobacter molluscorum]AXX93664.1 putative membrane protein [Malaciobacter molluscorum LMG 25693]PHO17926.1 hypothetical protein CPU12_08295 [Malaciobacter molluscorum LMG 25693]RXJ93659.1 hypothetical protein CRV00_10415 [Malaciobacter molluscorum]